MSRGWQRRLYYSTSFRTGTALLADDYAALLAARARDVTDRCLRRSCLVVAPHPDDETLGCGGTIAGKRAAGADVAVVVVTDGRHSHRSARITPGALAAIREEEARRACGALGVRADQVHFLRYEEGTLTGRRAELRAALDALLAAHRPEEVFVPSAIDRLEDHREVHAAAVHAAGRAPGRPDVYEYPIWMWDPQAWIDRDAPALRKAAQLVGRPPAALARLRPVHVAVGAALDAKRTAMAAYRSQLTNLTGEDTWATMDPRFLERFLDGRELFFRAAPGCSDGEAAP